VVLARPVEDVWYDGGAATPEPPSSGFLRRGAWCLVLSIVKGADGESRFVRRGAAGGTPARAGASGAGPETARES